MKRALVLVLSLAPSLLFATACDNVRVKNSNLAPAANLGVRFEPHSAVSVGARVTPEAVRFYPGDVDTLRRFQPSYVGELVVDVHKQWGWEKTPQVDELVARTAVASAENGATHFILVEAGVDVHERLLTPDTTESTSEKSADADGGAHAKKLEATRPAEGAAKTTPRGRFLAYRIEPARWSELPLPLQPKPLPGGTDVTPAPAAGDGGVSL